MKNQALISSKDKSKKLKCCLLQFLFGALKVKDPLYVILILTFFWFSAVSIFTIPGIALHRDPGMRSSSLSSSGNLSCLN